MLRRNATNVAAFIAIAVWIVIDDATDASFLGSMAIAAAIASVLALGIAITHDGDPLHYYRKQPKQDPPGPGG